MVRRLGGGLGVAVFAFGLLGGTAAAHSGHGGPENFGGNSPTIVNDFGGHYVNANNPALRWDWTCHQFATPGHGDDHANQEHSAVIDRTNPSALVAPGDKSNAC